MNTDTVEEQVAFRAALAENVASVVDSLEAIGKKTGRECGGRAAFRINSDSRSGHLVVDRHRAARSCRRLAGSQSCRRTIG